MPKSRVSVLGNVADAAAAYETLHVDMEFVGFFLGRMAPESVGAASSVQAAFDQEAFWAAASVLYWRCFNPGPRKRYAERVPIPDHLQAAHKRVREARTKAAHETRQSLGGVHFVLAPDNWPRAAQRYVQAQVRLIPAAPADLLELVNYLHDQFKVREAAATQRIKAAFGELDDGTIERMAAENKPLRVDDPEFAV